MTTFARSSPSPSPANANTSSGLSRTLSTIRAVTSFDDKPRQSFDVDDEASSTSSPSITRNSNSAFSSSVNSNVSTASFTSQPHSPPSNAKSAGGRLKHSAATPSLPNGSSVSSLEVPSARSGSSTIRPGMDTPSREGSLSYGASKAPIAASMGTTSFGSPNGGRPAFSNNNGSANNRDADDQGDGAGSNWDSSVGKAGLGKTGRVINRLVSDNEALKRDLKIEGLKAEEAKQAARLLEDKIERIVSDYESQLLEASVTKTLLARKERQVESLQGAVQLEKKRTTDAQDRERTWREETEKIKTDSKRTVEEATQHATLMEGRYNAISSHWRDQGEAVKRAAARMGKDVKELSEARRQDDEKINMLRDLCDQQDSNIKLLVQQKEDIARKFAEYKKEQEDLLKDIKTNAVRREAEQERTLQEAREVLDKLKWSLNIKNTIEWAN
ncbi:mother-specific HO expression [Sporothrix stenoceras]|uniref:Mother-specific HO expression n=1 Tax=Sporothrix stenoceras TaxID=5173 RepID=A0ABR3ZC60_9PEZI